MSTDIRRKNKEHHTKLVLNHIRKYGPISRIELCKALKISKPTITNIITELLESKLVIETGTIHSEVGRRRIQLEINSEWGFSIGINITRSTIFASVINMGLSPIDSVNVPISRCLTPADFLQALGACIHKLMQQTRLDIGNCLGIGIGCPGFVDYHNTIILNCSVEPGLQDERKLGRIEVGQYLNEQFGIPVILENDANVRAMGEYWFGYGMECNNLLLVLCSEGVGSGIIQKGHILRGEMSLNHGMGHLLYDPNGPKCVCCRQGCVETFASRATSVREVREQMEQGYPTTLSRKWDLNPESVTIWDIGRCADEGDQLCMDVLKKAAAAVGLGIAMLAGIVNPEMIILAGETVNASLYFYNTIVKTTTQAVFPPLSPYLNFQRRLVNDSIYEIGAAALIFRKYVY